MSDRVNREWIGRPRYPKRGEGAETEKKPYLLPSCVEGAPSTLVLVVANAEPMRQNTAALVSFREYPGYVLWLARGDLRNADDQMRALGLEGMREWSGRRMTLEKVRRTDPHRGGFVEKYVPAPAAQVTSAQRAAGTESDAPEAEYEVQRRVRRRF